MEFESTTTVTSTAGDWSWFWWLGKVERKREEGGWATVTTAAE